MSSPNTVDELSPYTHENEILCKLVNFLLPQLNFFLLKPPSLIIESLVSSIFMMIKSAQVRIVDLTD